MITDNRLSFQASPYTGPTAEDLAHIPADLKTRRQWILWRGADRIDKQTGEIVGLDKIPVDARALRHASTTDPETWVDFRFCVEALPVALEEWHADDPGAYRGGGIGYVFSHDDPYVGIDLDHCRDPVTGTIAPWAQTHMDALASYAEVSPSGTGVHMVIEGTLPPHGRKKADIEMYAYARFFTMTGWHLTDTPPTIEPRQHELITMHTIIFRPTRVAHQSTTTTPLIDDVTLLEKARAAKNGDKFSRLWAGDTSMHAG